RWAGERTGRGGERMSTAPNITAVIARVVVDGVEEAIPIYQAVAGGAQVQRFGFGEVRLASVGPFLLLSGNTAAFANRVATLLVRDLAPVVAEILRAGGELLDGPAPGPNGDRPIARNPDGAVFEDIQKPAAQPPTRHPSHGAEQGRWLGHAPAL